MIGRLVWQALCKGQICQCARILSTSALICRSFHTLESGTPMFTNFWNFFHELQSYYRLQRLKFYYISLHILRGYIFFLPNFPEATFIQGATSIPDSRVKGCFLELPTQITVDSGLGFSKKATKS